MAVNKVARGDGFVLIDLSTDTVTSAYDIVAGKVGHLANGAIVTGLGSETLDFTDISASGDGNVTIEGTSVGSVTITDEANATGITCVITTSAEPEPAVTWETLYEGQTQLIDDTPYPYWWISSLSDVYPTDGSVWRVTMDGTEYAMTATTTTVSGSTAVCVGNPLYSGGTDDGSGVPFNFFNLDWGAWSGGADLAVGNHQVKIERQVSA